MSKQYFILTGEAVRQRAMASLMSAPLGYCLSIQEPTRTLEQNSLLWPLLTDLSRQVNWYGNKLTQEEWKDVMTAAIKKQKVVPGVDGSFVVCGQRTSKMGKKEFSDLIEVIYAFGAEQGVQWTEKKLELAA